VIDYYPVEPIREAVQASDLPLNTIAVNLGYLRKTRGRYIKGDTARVKRHLGIMPQYNVKVRQSGQVYRHKAYSKNMKYETALKIINALGLDPVDFGL
jgi:hypothetical protein